VASIRYSQVDGANVEDGLLLYLKPAFYGSEPADVYNYAKGCEDFPHESTADQFFSESQFESYRALGYHTLQQIWGQGGAAGGLEDLMTRVRIYLGMGEDAPGKPEAAPTAGLGPEQVREHLAAAQTLASESLD
jgi:hypothetical protein